MTRDCLRTTTADRDAIATVSLSQLPPITPLSVRQSGGPSQDDCLETVETVGLCPSLAALSAAKTAEVEPGTTRPSVTLLGAVTYEWFGETKRAVASWPDVVITLEDRWVSVSRIGRGTELVAWSWVRTLSGSSLPPRAAATAAEVREVLGNVEAELDAVSAARPKRRQHEERVSAQEVGRWLRD